MGWAGWLTNSGRLFQMVTRQLQIECRSEGQGKFAGQRPTFYRCVTQRTGTTTKPYVPCSGVFGAGGGGRLCDRPPWSDREFLDNFCAVFVSLVSRLNRKIRVARLLATVRVFCRLKTASKCTQTYHFGDKKWCFSGERT